MMFKSSKSKLKIGIHQVRCYHKNAKKYHSGTAIFRHWTIKTELVTGKGCVLGMKIRNK